MVQVLHLNHSFVRLLAYSMPLLELIWYVCGLMIAIFVANIVVLLYVQLKWCLTHSHKHPHKIT